MVDGGINGETALLCAECGANAFVAGTFLFRAADMAGEISRLRQTTTEIYPTS
jgi:ribulose-phosphate 3-epimerase